MLESQAEFGKKSGSNQERTQELLGHPDACHILFSSGRSQIKQLCNSIIHFFLNHHTVARLTCVGGKRLSTIILLLEPWDFKFGFDLQT
jgi:hypothetical protein